MANNASNYLENALLNHIFANNGGVTYTPPLANSADDDTDGIFLSLHTTAGPLDDNSGTGTELTLGSYARSNASDTLTFTVTGNSATNNQAIVFPQATANYDGEVTHIGRRSRQTSVGKQPGDIGSQVNLC